MPKPRDLSCSRKCGASRASMSVNLGPRHFLVERNRRHHGPCLGQTDDLRPYTPSAANEDEQNAYGVRQWLLSALEATPSNRFGPPTSIALPVLAVDRPSHQTHNAVLQRLLQGRTMRATRACQPYGSMGYGRCAR